MLTIGTWGAAENVNLPSNLGFRLCSSGPPSSSPDWQVGSNAALTVDVGWGTGAKAPWYKEVSFVSRWGPM